MRRYLLFVLAAASLWGQKITSVSQLGNNPSQLSPGTLAAVFGTDFTSQATVKVNGLSTDTFLGSNTFVTFRIPSSVPVGSASVVVTTSAGSSAPFSITLLPVSPSINTDSLSSPPAHYHYGVGGPKDLFPQPGELISIRVTGVGATQAASPKVLIDGVEFPIAGIGTISGILFGGPTAIPTSTPAVTFTVPDLQPGRHALAFQIGGVTSPTIPLDLLYSGIITSQTGLTFTAVQGGPSPAAQTVSVLSGVGIINFNLTTSTISGGSWLSVTPASGSAEAGKTGVPIKVSVNPTGLTAGPYYGTIQVAASGVLNSPQSITVVLRIAPAGTALGATLETSGLIFSGTQGAANPPAQTVTISNPTTAALTFTPTIALTSGSNQWSVTPSTATPIPSGQSVTLSVQASLAGAAPGVYTARVNLAFSDQSVRSISLLLVVVSNSASPKAPPEAGGCVPTKLLPVFTQPGSGFSVPAAWPTPIVVSVVDDCATPLTTGTVSATFGNGDPPLQLSSLRNGSWAGTWAAVAARSTGFSVFATANDASSGLTGSGFTTGVVGTNADVPIISQGGVVDAASYGPVLTPGALFAVFGAKLSTGTGPATSLPLPTVLSNTTLLLGSKPVPLYYTSDGQLLAMVPYDVAQNTNLQMVARSGNALSSPQPVSVLPVRPAVWTVNASGTGQGHIYRYDVAGNALLADSKNPAKAGDVLVIYCMGLGAVDPAVQAGVAAPVNVLSKSVNAVTATVGGISAPIAFAGVTPGGTGLYQVNLTVPTGLPDNDATPLILSSGGQNGIAVTFSVRR